MSRTDTTSVESMTISRPRQEVTFEFHPREDTFTTIIRIPQGSKWTPSPHWHERYTEYFRVLQGRIRLNVNGATRIVLPEDGEQCIMPFQVHEFMRADCDAADDQSDDEEVVVEERVDPGMLDRSMSQTYVQVFAKRSEADGLKEVFFRNLASTLQEPSKGGSKPSVLQIRITSNAYDNFDVMMSGGLSWYVTHMVYGISSVLGYVWGLSPWYQEYTPVRLRGIAASQGRSGDAKAKGV